MPPLNRRQFLRSSALGTGIGATLGLLSRRAVAGSAASLLTSGYGPLRPAVDETTGIELIRLPEGFRCISFGWTGDPMEDGAATPSMHDGMAVVTEADGILSLIRNHEVEKPGAPFGAAEFAYDPKAQGGCTVLRFDGVRGKWLSSRTALSGTVRNCAGGPTPWGTWLTCEEAIDDEANGFDRSHGWVFEVSPDAPTAAPVPIRGMGRFFHEAVAVDPETGTVYLTEDRKVCGLYRYRPVTPGRLHEGGTLEVLQAVGAADLREGHAVGSRFDVRWIPLENTEEARTPSEDKELATQGGFVAARELGATTFARLEGCCFSGGRIYLTATIGGRAKMGQVWQYEPREERLTLLFESPSREVLDMPDNMTVSPRGGIVLCEDDDEGTPMRLRGLTRRGQIFAFAANNLDLTRPALQRQLRDSGKRTELRDYQNEEWCGATFSRDGRWLFANLQTPGITVAITGPWQEGLI